MPMVKHQPHRPLTYLIRVPAPALLLITCHHSILPKVGASKKPGAIQFLFFDWAKDEPNFVLNWPEHDGASLLVAGPNFGCGSSREHAPWAIEDRGIRAIIAPSFGEIFRTNCVAISLLPVELVESDVADLARIAEESPSQEVEIDLAQQQVTSGGFRSQFEIDSFEKYRLANGLDRIALTLESENEIAEYESLRREFKPDLDIDRDSGCGAPVPITIIKS